MKKRHTIEDIQVVLEFMSIYPHSGCNREAKEIILQFQAEIELLTQEADNRVQSMADQLEKAQIALGDKLFQAHIDATKENV